MQNAMEMNAGYWAAMNKIKLQAGIFSFKTREYQVEPLSPIKRTNVLGEEIWSAPRRTCFMKATQLGITENEVIRSLHGLIYERYPKGILYLMPSNDDVREFGKSRFNPLIQTNRNAIGQYLKSTGKKGTDTESLKKVGDAFLWLRGARQPRRIDEQAVTPKTSSIPIDRLVFDELDLMANVDSEFTIIGKARGRYGDSLLKEECFISNPTTPNFGIDVIFASSDQRHWFRYCQTCGKHTTCAELYFMEDPERCVRIRKNGTGYIACKTCGNEIPCSPGEWVPKYPLKSDYMYGYQLSQLTSVRNDPAEILAEYRNPPEDNLSEIVRLRLGWPHISAAEKLSKDDVLACCDSNNTPRNSHPGPCAMGLDCMKTKNLIIGARKSDGNYVVLHTAVIAGQGMEAWNEVSDLCNRFNVKSGVIDIRPYEDMARHFQKTHKNMNIWLCEYKETTPLGTVYNPNTGLVLVSRTEIMDTSHRVVSTPGKLIILRRSDKMIDFAKQVASAFKVLETNKKTGQKVYRYRKTNVPDHFRHALNYFLLAASSKKVGSIERIGHRAKKKKKTVNNEYARA